MEAVSLSFNDFDLVTDAFKAACMNRVVTVIQDPVLITQQAAGEPPHFRVVNGFCQRIPLLNSLFCLSSRPIGPDVFEFCLLGSSPY